MNNLQQRCDGTAFITPPTVSGHYFVFDTSSLLFDAGSLTYYSNNNIIIPVSVLEELDKHKDRQDEVGKNARTVNRALYDLKKLGDLSQGVLHAQSNCTISIFPEKLEDVPKSLDSTKPDNRILSTCFTLLHSYALPNEVTLVTNDLNLALKAEAYGIKSEAFISADIFKPTGFTGHREMIETEDILIDQIYSEGHVPCPKSLAETIYPNEFLLITNPANGKQSVRVRYKRGRLHRLPNNQSVYDVRPLNNEQAYALELLMDPEVKLVTLAGLAGSGKTLLAVAAGLSQVLEEGKRVYDRMIISRSLVLLSGKDRLGFLKGGLKEKLDPYLLPLKDAIEQVVGDMSGLEYLTADRDEEGQNRTVRPKIEFEALQYIRGRSLRSVYFIVDEAQNLSLAELKAIISRIGEGSKIVLLADLDQVDNVYLNKYTNGLAQVVEKFKDCEISGHVHLREGVRSILASEAALRL